MAEKLAEGSLPMDAEHLRRISGLILSLSLKVRKHENFFSDFECCIFYSLLCLIIKFLEQTFLIGLLLGKAGLFCVV